MNAAVIDADLIGRIRHRLPNLYSPSATATADSLRLSCSTFIATWRNTMTKILTFACWLIAAPVVFAGIVLNAALNFFEKLSSTK